jgi:hypothetical protein
VPGPSSGGSDALAVSSTAELLSSGVINPFSIANWDLLLARFPSATFFHSVAWAKVLYDAYAFEPTYLLVGALDAPISILPMMDVRSWITGNRGVSLPFTDECGALCVDDRAFSASKDLLLDLAKRKNWSYFECRGGPTFGPESAGSPSFFGHRLDLTPGLSVIFEKFASSTRRAIRKAQESGLSVEFSQELDTVRAFHGLLCKTRKRHGMPPQPFSFFKAIHRHILGPGKGWVALARLGKTPVAGAVFFQFGSMAIYKYGASDDAYQLLRANNLVMWNSIERLCQKGIRTLDFGRTSLGNEGLRRFKLGWGTAERPINYTRYDCRKKCYVSVSDHASGWHNHAIRMLPTAISRIMGTVLYKHAA